MSKSNEHDLISEINIFLTRLQMAPWVSLPTGTQVVHSFADSTSGYTGIKHHVQPDLSYEIIEKGKALIRKQMVDGKETTQVISLLNEVGLPRAMPCGNPDTTIIDIDGVPIDSHRWRCVLKTHTTTGYFERITVNWAMSKNHLVLLKRIEHDGDYWEVKGFSVRTINGREYRCIKTEQRMTLVDGFTVIIKHLNPDVPGHVLEEVHEYYTKNSKSRDPTLTMMTRKFVKTFRIVGETTQQTH